MASLFVADLDPRVDEAMLFKVFSDVGPIASIRLCREKNTKEHLGCAYVNFKQQADAEIALEKNNFEIIHGRPMRIMWVKISSIFQKPDGGNIFVKNLPKNVDIKKFRGMFVAFGNVVSCKLAFDGQGESKCYGYVQFEREDSADSAIEQLNGVCVGGRELVVSRFVPRERRAREQQTNNIYIKNLPEDLGAAVDMLTRLFQSYGSILSCKVVDDREHRGFGFVSFESPRDAARAVEELDGLLLAGGKRLYVAPAQKKCQRRAMLRQRHEALRRERAEASRGRNLYVKNLDASVDDDFLRQQFSVFGGVLSAKVAETLGRSRGFGFVCLSTVEEASAAIAAMHGRAVRGKPMYVCLAQTREERRAYLAEKFRRADLEPSSEPVKVQEVPGTSHLPQGDDSCRASEAVRVSSDSTTQTEMRDDGDGEPVPGGTPPEALQMKNTPDDPPATLISGEEENSCDHPHELVREQNGEFENEESKTQDIFTEAAKCEAGESVPSHNSSHGGTESSTVEQLLLVVREMYPESVDKVKDFLRGADLSGLQSAVRDRKEMERKITRLVTLIEIHDFMTYKKDEFYSEALKQELLQKFTS
ncbi:polyadenylate-binding protein 1-like [Bacillus rossius redtenbacheri]|uniref:polyadenylate-binding protein 1-like n=1 Tax=Bacillus rossius redtenbacheri TaxID=93214 RepID=UPI002FDC96A6